MTGTDSPATGTTNPQILSQLGQPCNYDFYAMVKLEILREAGMGK